MNRTVILSPDAKADFSSAILWYQRAGPNVAFRFIKETLGMLHRIGQYPYAYPIIKRKIRRAVLHDFPYSIYFTLKYEVVSVIAVVHQRRNHTVMEDGADGRS